MVSTAQFEYQGWVSMVFMIAGAGIAAKATIKPTTSRAAVPAAESRTV
jgi:hypothetical protein